MNRSSILPVLLSAILASVGVMQAQHGADTRLLVIEGTIGPHERKAILSVIHAQDADVIIGLSDDGHLAKIRSSVVFDLGMLQAELAPLGLLIHWLIEPAPTGTGKSIMEKGANAGSNPRRHPEAAVAVE